MNLQTKTEAESSNTEPGKNHADTKADEFDCVYCKQKSVRPRDFAVPEGEYVPDNVCLKCYVDIYSSAQSKLERGVHDRYFSNAA